MSKLAFHGDSVPKGVAEGGCNRQRRVGIFVEREPKHGRRELDRSLREG
jgi:hypothetical protein